MKLLSFRVFRWKGCGDLAAPPKGKGLTSQSPGLRQICRTGRGELLHLLCLMIGRVEVALAQKTLEGPAVFARLAGGAAYVAVYF